MSALASIISRITDRTVLRRAALFATNIGVPFLAAMLLGHQRAALLGAVIGLLSSFADENARPLGDRLKTLVMAMMGIAGGGTLGHLLPNYPPLFWVIFALIVFAAGWANQLGKGPHLALRFAAIALALLSGLPPIAPQELWFVAIAFAIAVVTRVIDHLMNGPMPGAAPPPGKFSTPRDWIIFAAAYGGAATLGLAVGVALGATRAIWIMTAPLVVMVPDAKLTYRRGLDFVIGTVLGVGVTWGLTQVVQSVWAIASLILLISILIPHHIPKRFWLQTALIAVMLLLAYSLILPNQMMIGPLIAERLEDIVFGCGLAVISTALAFSRIRSARPPTDDEHIAASP